MPNNDARLARPARLSWEWESARLGNLTALRPHLGSVGREVLVRDHRPGEVWYNLHEYPKLPLRQPSQEDWDRFASYAADGIEIVKFHMEWADWAEICGGDSATAADPAGLDVLVDMAHQHGLKVLLYFSSGFHDTRSSRFDPSWTVTNLHLREHFYDLALCSPRHPGWRAHVVQSARRIMTSHDVDGLYNDCGFFDTFDLAWRHTHRPGDGDMPQAFRESPTDQEAFSDLLHLLHDEMKSQRPGAIMGLYCGRTRRPPVSGRPYDRLYVGEAVDSLDELVEATGRHEPYTYVIPDARMVTANPRTLYAVTMPHLQFPVSLGGAPVTGERITSDLVDYADPDNDYWIQVMARAAHHHRRTDPPSYGWWDSVPGDPEVRQTHRRFLQLWKEISPNGTRAFLDAQSDLVAGPPGLTTSFFVSDRIYAVIANCTSQLAHARIATQFRDLEHGHGQHTIAIPPYDLRLVEFGLLHPATRSAWSQEPATHDSIGV